MEPATKQDIKDAIAEFKQWMLEREVTSIRWFIGMQFGYTVVIIGAMYFMLQHH